MSERNPELEEFTDLVEAMRDAQTAYFRTRNQDVLETARQLERAVDKRIQLHRRRSAPQRQMFGD